MWHVLALLSTGWLAVGTAATPWTDRKQVPRPTPVAAAILPFGLGSGVKSSEALARSGGERDVSEAADGQLTQSDVPQPRERGGTRLGSIRSNQEAFLRNQETQTKLIHSIAWNVQSMVGVLQHLLGKVTLPRTLAALSAHRALCPPSAAVDLVSAGENSRPKERTAGHPPLTLSACGLSSVACVGS